MLTDDELLQYNRQILYEDFGEKGQLKLKQSHIVIAGLGGVGCTAVMQLTCSGIVHISVVDSDTVDISNLNRQVLHWHNDIGKKKATSVAEKMARLNPSINVTPIHTRITEINVRNIIKEADAVLDAVDNYDTRFILNKACVTEEIPFVHGAVHGLYDFRVKRHALIVSILQKEKRLTRYPSLEPLLPLSRRFKVSRLLN